jgi:chromosome segregation protein
VDKGAHFYRCDFQVHTPRDQNWKGKDAATAEERAEYAQSLVSYCRSHDLHAIAVTDHHDMAFVPYVLNAATAETDDSGEVLPRDKRLVVFPGMELTLGVPCQAILLLDADFPENMFVPLLTALHLTPPTDDQPRNGNVARLDDVHSFVDLKQELDRHSWLKDKYIIFPNVTGEGEYSLLRQGQMGKYIEMPCVGGYIDGSVSKLKPGRKSILDGYDKAWGNKRIACFQTSDNRYEDHRDLGTSTTWVKWATPTSEALRQACLAQESRVSQETPLLPSLVIASISVSNSLFLGPIDLELNPQYNALIGGRGTGKSTILEYLRWALCDQPPGIDDVETPNYQARRSRLIEQTLKPLAATVEVRFEINGVPHIVRRSSADGSILLKLAASEMRPCTEDEVRSLLPIEAYSQKQLSDVSVRIDELTRFVTAPIRGELNRIDRELDDHAERIRQSYATQRRRRALEQTIQTRELEAKSLAEQADALRAGLTGLSEEDRALLDRGKVFDAANQSVEGWIDGIRSVGQGVGALKRTVSTALTQLAPPPIEPPSAALIAAHAEYQALLDEAKLTLNALSEKSASLLNATAGGDTATPWQQWAAELAEFKASYDAAVRKSSSHTEKLQQLQAIEAQALKLNREIAQLKEELRALSETETSYLADRQAWQELLGERDALFEAQCASLTTNSGQAIRARVKRFASADDFTTLFRQALSGSRLQGNKIELIGESIVAAPTQAAHWNAILSDLEKLAEHDPERDAAERRPETPTLASIGLSSGDLDRIGRTLKPEHWLSLSLTPIKSVPVFEYQSREAEYIPFSNASAGQQATALLETLLTQGTFPLIIDQPEEDLDNPVMLEIVAKIWQAKQRRQIIFASHNANLVVNGDAELVAWCNYRAMGDQSRGTIGGTGAIDVPDVREAIKKIMEGGEAAFKLRREKYGF